MKKCFLEPNKSRYNTKQEAEKVLIIIFDRGELNPYYCDSCKGWHLTSNNSGNF